LITPQPSIIIHGRNLIKDAKFTVRISCELLENARVYAKTNYTTLADLIKSFFKNIPAQFSLENAPIVRRLSGSLPKDLAIQDYKDHLEEKFGK
jgi:hypothetical protein